MLSAEPIFMTCPSCNEKMTTAVTTKTPIETHAAACLLLILFFPLAWLPYCVNVSVLGSAKKNNILKYFLKGS